MKFVLAFASLLVISAVVGQTALKVPTAAELIARADKLFVEGNAAQAKHPATTQALQIIHELSLTQILIAGLKSQTQTAESLIFTEKSLAVHEGKVHQLIAQLAKL